MSPANLSTHLSDARFHLTKTSKSLDAARDFVRKEASDRELAALDRYARLARGLLVKVGRRELHRRRSR